MAALSTFLRFLKWKMDGKWKMENALRENGGPFHVFEVSQMANGWKMETGFITLGCC
jgi:hypothetical protein